MKLNQYNDSVIDTDTIEVFENDTKTEWTDKHELMARVCSYFDYGFNWNDKGNIVINDGFYEGNYSNDAYEFIGENTCGHHEYNTVEDMLKDWEEEMIKANKVAEENKINLPFDNLIIKDMVA